MNDPIETGVNPSLDQEVTFILNELLKQKVQGWVVAIADREATKAAFRAGVGQAFDQKVGGKTDKLRGEPVQM